MNKQDILNQIQTIQSLIDDLKMEIEDMQEAEVEAQESEQSQTFDERLEEYVHGVQKKMNDYFEAKNLSWEPDKISIDEGRRYIRIVKTSMPSKSKSVHSFIDKTNGDVLKSASWKAPAKHARGNIYNNDFGLDNVNQFGANYLK